MTELYRGAALAWYLCAVPKMRTRSAEPFRKCATDLQNAAFGGSPGAPLGLRNDLDCVYAGYGTAVLKDIID